MREPAHFKGWAYRITTSKAVDWMRKDRRRRRLATEVSRNPRPEAAKDTGIRELLDRLDTKKKVVLSLYYLEQLTVTEISMALRIPKGTVRSRLYNAREELRRLWQQHVDK